MGSVRRVNAVSSRLEARHSKTLGCDSDLPASSSLGAYLLKLQTTFLPAQTNYDSIPTKPFQTISSSHTTRN